MFQKEKDKWYFSDMSKTIRLISPVLKTTIPVVTGDWDGNVKGTGKFRFKLSIKLSINWMSNYNVDKLSLGLDYVRNTYNPELKRQGWRNWRMIFNLLFCYFIFELVWNDDPTGRF